MKYIFAAWSLFFCVTVSIPNAEALEVTVGQVRIKLAGPDGFCALDAKHPLDSQVIAAAQQAVQSRNDEIGFFVACDRLTAWREGKASDLGDTADYQVQKATKLQTFPAGILSEVCALLRKQGSSIVKGVEGEINQNYKSIEALAGRLKLNSQEMYGVLHEDKTACYAGVVQKLQMDTEEHTLFTVMAVTLIKGKILYFYHASRLTGPKTIIQLLKTSRKTIASTLALN